MASNQHITGFNHSQAIRQRLIILLCNISCEQALFSYIEHITLCDFASEPMFDRLTDEISNNPNAVNSVKQGYRVWKAIREEDRRSVLYCFLLLFDEQAVGFSAAQKIELFCRLFFRDFIPVLVEYATVQFFNVRDHEI
jgi:hypothetical protein